MILRRTIASLQIVIECDPYLAAAAADVFDVLAAMARSGKPPNDAMRIRFGWSLLVLRAEHGFLRVCEPRFTADDPLAATAETLDVTLSVIVRQLAWLHQLRERGVDVRFDQRVVVARNALAGDDIFALRGKPPTDIDSGWSVAPVPAEGAQVDTSDLSAIPVFRLVGESRNLLSILTLPVGYLVRLRNDEIVEISDNEDNVRWISDEDAGR